MGKQKINEIVEVIGYEILTKIIRKGYFNADLEETSLWKPIVPMVNEEGLMDHFRGYIKGLNHQDFGQVRGFESVIFRHRGSDTKQVFASTNLAQYLEYVCMLFPIKHNSSRDSTAAASRR